MKLDDPVMRIEQKFYVINVLTKKVVKEFDNVHTAIKCMNYLKDNGHYTVKEVNTYVSKEDYLKLVGSNESVVQS